MDEKKISLNDILSENVAEDMKKKAESVEAKVAKSGGAPTTRRVVEDITEIAPMRPQKDPQKEFEDHYYNMMDNAIERTKKAMYEERIKPWQDKCKELALEAELNGEEEPTELADMVNAPSVNQVPVQPKEQEPPTQSIPEVNQNDSIATRIRSDIEQPKVVTELNMQGGQDIELDIEDFDDDLIIKNNDDKIEDINNDEEAEDESKKIEEQENQKRLLAQLRGELNNHLSYEKVNLNDYSIGDSKININTTMSRIVKDTDAFSKTQSVPLFDTGRMISFTPLSGTDIVALSSDNYDSNLETLRKTYSVMYKHDASIDKSKVNFTTWMKTTAAGDLYQLYFGLYKATFAGSNYIAYKCPECDNFFMVHKDIKEMYSINKEATEEQKKRLSDIEQHGEVEDNIKNRAELFQVSENYVILIHPKTLYNTLELEYLDDEFKRKYSAILQPMQYIDKIFFIDKDRKRLVPIDLHPVADSIAKTIKNKCVIIHKLISTITVEQYSILTGKLALYNYREIEATRLFDYHIPAQECTESYTKGPKAGKKCTYKFKEEEMTPYAMLFTRHQLYINTTLTI